MKDSIQIIPIGGVGEIGSNMTLFKNDDSSFLVDCGILFPYDDFFDIDYLIPDLNFLNDKNVTDIIITHGHEDHIGAIAHLLEKFPDIKVHCSNFAASLIRRRLVEMNLVRRLNIIKATSQIQIGSLVIETFHATHSIPETMGLVISDKLKNYRVLYLSDFKYDKSPLYERGFDIKRLKELFPADAYTMAMIDSTNILNPGKTVSESELLEGIETCFKKNKGRMFVTLFSSNIFRMQTFINLARKYNRVFTTLGRSVNFYLTEARANGLVQYHENELKNPEDMIENDNAIIFTSGCQADHFSAMKKLGYGEHHLTKLKKGDTVIFSSKVIPGNEDKVYRLYNKITEVGAELITEKDLLIHASGHPSQEDLKELIQEIKPSHYIPIHGETLFLKRHCEFIDTHFPQIKNYFISNYTQIHFSPKGVELKSLEQRPPVLIHGDKLEIEREKISERRKMACNGMVFVSLSPKEVQLQISGLPQIIDKEIPHLRKLAYDNYRGKKGNAEKVRVALRRYLYSLLGYKPICFVMEN